jgi:hypothetical protein
MSSFWTGHFALSGFASAFFPSGFFSSFLGSALGFAASLRALS